MDRELTADEQDELFALFQLQERQIAEKAFALVSDGVSTQTLNGLLTLYRELQQAGLSNPSLRTSWTLH